MVPVSTLWSEIFFPLLHQLPYFHTMEQNTFTEMQIPKALRTKSAKGVGCFFSHSNNNEFVLWRIFSSRLKKGSFANGSAPSFIECRNLHKIQESASCAVFMYNSVSNLKPKSPTDNPGTIFHLGLLWGFDIENGVMQFLHYTGNRHARSGNQFELVPKKLFSSNNRSVELLFSEHFQLSNIRLGYHSVYFVNQIEGISFSHMQVRDNIIGEDGCYQCSTQGPDIYFSQAPTHNPIESTLLSTMLTTYNIGYDSTLLHKGDISLNTPTECVYFVLQNEHMKNRTKMLENHFAVHFPSTYNYVYIHVAFVKKSDLDMLLNDQNGWTIEVFERLLMKYAQFHFWYLNIDISKHSSQIRVYAKDEKKELSCLANYIFSKTHYDGMMNESTNSSILRLDGCFDSYALPGCMIAKWSRDKSLQKRKVSEFHVDVFWKANRNGYGSRSTSSSLGVASYFGQRGSNQSTNSPIECPGNQNLSQYFRKDNNRHPEYMIISNIILNGMSKVAGQIRNSLDPTFSKIVCQDDDENYNRMKSVTFGYPNSTLSFCNSMHTDQGDKFVKQDSTSILEMINSSGCFNQNEINYAKKFISMWGAGKPTTVLYQHIGKSHLQQIFIHNGVNCASRITDLSSLVFYPFTHPHCSSVALSVGDDGRVRIKNTGNEHIFAFCYSC